MKRKIILAIVWAIIACALWLIAKELFEATTYAPTDSAIECFYGISAGLLLLGFFGTLVAIVVTLAHE